MPPTHSDNLEYRLFLKVCILGLLISFTLVLLDVFIIQEFDPSIVGIFSFINFSFFYYQARYKKRFRKLLTPFLIILIVIINCAWFLGGGLNITNAFIFLFIVLLTIIFSPAAQRPIFLALISVNLAVFIALEFLYLTNSLSAFKSDQPLLINSITLLLVVGTMSYIMIFFKDQYDVERETVKKQNQELDAFNSEIETRNEELIQYQEEVMAQRDFIEEKNKKLEHQAVELEKAHEKIMVINESLEEKVKDRTSKLLDLNNNLDLLVYRSSHDFRRPLTTLMGLNEIARLTIKDEVSQELFNKVNETARNMDKMLLKFFMLYNINHFRKTYEGSTLEQIIDKIDENMISRKRNITFNRKVETRNYKEKDERNGLIEIILENLVENSLIYNNKSKMVIDLEIVEKNGNLHIFQSDNGNGIPSSYQEKIFDMYFRGSTLSTGNGLGLFVAKRAADLLNALVKLDSEEGEYTRFGIEFKI